MGGKPKYTEEELLELLKAWAKKHNKSPSARDINKDESMPDVTTYKRRFGSFNKVKQLAGLEIIDFSYTDEELLKLLKEWSKANKKSPSINDINKDESMPNVSTYIRHFGSFNRVKELAGLEIFEYDSELNYVSSLLEEWKNGRYGEISESTLDSYLRHLKDLEEFLEENGKTLKELSIIDIKNYVLLVKGNYAKNSMSQKFNAIRNFLKFFLRKGIIEKTEPLFDLAMIEYVDGFFRKQMKQMEDDAVEDEALSEEEVKIIKEKLKDYPMFQIMFILDLNLGLRASEFCKIKTNEGTIRNRKQARKNDIWIDLNRGILMIYRGKSKRPHLVALTEEMKTLVKKQLLLRKLYGVTHEFLFFSKKGNPLRKNRIIMYYGEISKITGIKVTSHKVRRTMATLFEKKGVPHSIIQKRMGHSPKDITQEYQRYPIEEKIEILDKKIGIL